MNDSSNTAQPGLGEQLSIRPIDIDEWSDVRSLHIQSFKHLTGAHLEAELVEHARLVFSSPEYTDELMLENVAGAFLDGRLVGTCGWRPTDDTGTLVRITALFVDPLFTGLGVGRRLVEDAEARAQAAGFASFTTRATLLNIGFFENLGYEVSSHGLFLIGEGGDMPVTFLRKTNGNVAPPLTN